MNGQDGVLYLQNLRQGRQPVPVASIRKTARGERQRRWSDPLNMGSSELGGRVDVSGDRILITQIERSTCIQSVEKPKEQR